MKILLLSDNMASGGAERQLSYLAMGLKKRGDDVRLIKFYEGANHYQPDLDKHGIKTEIELRGHSRLKRPFAIRRIVKEWNPEAVICYKDGCCMAACIARMMTNFKLIVSERNTTQALSKSERLKFRLYRKADWIVPNSFSQAKFISKHYPNLEPKVRVVTNMIDLGKFQPKEIYCRAKRGIVVARVSPQKNVISFLEALKILKNRSVDVKFDWYGSFNDKTYFDEVITAQKELDLEDMITFHGASKEIHKHYAEADFFCLPSLYEGFPNVLCEAMASGLPAIASNVCDNPNILQDKSMLFNPESSRDMASKIEFLAKLNVADLKALGSSNRGKIEELCDEKAFIDSYLQLI